MLFAIQKLQISDIQTSFGIEHAVFSRNAGAGNLGSLLPRSEPPGGSLRSTERHRQVSNDSGATSFLTVVETETNEMVVFGHWDIWPAERTQLQVEEFLHFDAAPDGIDEHQAYVDFVAAITPHRQAFGSRPIAILKLLTVAPQHQGRGIAKMLVLRFTRDVDEQGVDAYLESSVAGKSLYRKFGFAVKAVEEFDMAKYGGRGIDHYAIILGSGRDR